MNDITVIAVGNMKEDYYREAVNEYTKRISGYAKITLKELKEEKLSENPGEAEIAKVLEKEGKEILRLIPKNAYTIALCVEGKKLSSENFSKTITDACVNKPLYFVIGSSFGLSAEVKQFANAKISFSDMTFPHRLMRVILYEQIYRGLSIANNGKYHK